MRLDRPFSALACCAAAFLSSAPLSAQFSPRVGGVVGRSNRSGWYQGKHWGTIRRDGTVAVPFEYQALEQNGNLLIATQGTLQFLVKMNGEKASDSYSSIFATRGGYQVGKNLNPGFVQGFLDEGGKVLALPRYESITPPAFEIIVAKSGDLRGWINPSTRTFISPEMGFDLVQAVAPDLVICVQAGQRRVLGFHVDGKPKFEVPASDWPTQVGTTIRIPQNDGSVRWIDQNGKDSIPGQPVIATKDDKKDAYTSFFEAGKWGFKDGKGNVIVEPILDRPGAFQEGLASPVLHGKQGVIDTKGRWVIKPEFESLSEPGPDGWRVGTRDRKQGEWLRVSPKGETLGIPGHWSYVEPFDSLGRAIAVAF